MRTIYAEKALEEIPRLLSSLDRNPFSPTYGCFNREFWLTRVRDFPDAIAQFGTLSLALIWSNRFPGGERYYKNKEVLDWTLAGIKYWMKIQHSDGSYDEFYPNERGWAGPTGFLLYAMLRSYEVLGDAFPEELKSDFFKAVKRSACFLATRDESGVLANHHAMALLPIYQSHHHLVKEDPEFAKQLLKKFEERLEDFLSYHDNEGWSLEYDGIDPGYLSATVSFLSKMQRYMDGSESWKKKIEEVIAQSIDTVSYFFYPNGSYAGTVGSRQTLHFYAHGCELQAKNNPTAAACAAFGQQSLFEGKLIPPGVQDDRYYLYRIPEFLEAYLDGRDHAGVIKLPHQQERFEKYFEKARVYVHNTPKQYILLNLAKGGVLKIYDKEKQSLLFADDGIIATLNNGSVLTTQWIGPEYKVEINGNQFVVYGNLHKIPFQYFNPVTMIGFRIFMLLTGWNARLADFIKGTIRKLLMTKSSASPIVFERRFTFTDEAVTIMHAITAKKRVAHLRIGGQFAARYVPQSRYFQIEELDNNFWTADKIFLDTLNVRHFASVSTTINLAESKVDFALTKDPLKIVFVVNGRAHESGITSFINVVGDGMRDLGCSVDTITIFGRSRRREAKLGLIKKTDNILKSKPLLTYLAYRASKLLLRWHVVQNYRRNHYDMIVGMDMSAVNVSLLLKQIFGIKILHATFGTPSKALVDQGKIISGSVIQKLFAREERIALENTDINMAGQEHLNHIQAITQHPSPIRLVHAGIHLGVFRPNLGMRTVVKERFSITAAEKVIIYAGRLAEQKGVKFAILALKEILSQGKKYRLLIIGEGPEEKNLKALVSKTGLEHEVIFLGTVSHNKIAGYMQAADCFVFPSIKVHGITEIISQTPLEAMACGTPVVAFDILDKDSDIKPVMKSGTNSLLVKECDTQAMANAAIQASENMDLRNRLIASGLEEIRSEWSHVKVAKQLLNLS